MKNLKILSALFLLLLAAPAFGQWNNVMKYPSTATDGVFSFVINGKGYVGGGLSNNNFYSYDPAADKWTALKEVPSPGAHLTWAMAFASGGKGYVVGGSYGDLPDVTDAVWEYDPVANEWTQKSDFPGGGRDGAFAVTIGSKAYIGCGFDGQNIVQDIYEYDAVNDKWTTVEGYDGSPLIFPAAFSLNNKLYMGTGGNGPKEAQEFYEYDPMTSMWAQKASFPGDPRQTAVSFTDGTYGYVGGGMAGYSNIRKDFWRYDPLTDTWAKLNKEYPDNHVAWGTAFVIDNMAYIGMGADVPSFVFSNTFYKRDFSQAASVKNIQLETGLKLSPCPVTTTLQISLDQPSPIREIQIYDICGRLVKGYSSGFDSKALDVQDIPSGIYSVMVRTDKALYTGKIIRQ